MKNYSPNLKSLYNKEIILKLKEQSNYKSVMQVPRLEKILISRGVGSAIIDKKNIDYALEEITSISGQKAIKTYSKKDISSFKLRKRDANRS